MRSSVIFALLSLALPFVAADSHRLGARHHHEVAKRGGDDVEIHKRFANARFTFYYDNTGPGACGQTYQPNDYIVALNSAQYGSGSDCFKTITISANGKSTQAIITDECPGCPYGGLDLSTGLFDFFASESVGQLYGTWSFGSGGSDNPTTTQTTETPTTTWTPPSSTHKKTSTTSQTPSTTTASSTSSSSTHSHTSTSTASTTSIDYSTGAASGLAVPTGTAGDTSGIVSNIENFNQAIIDLGGLIVAAVDSN
jgi:hypothetical protein